jgi:hypothetical protein
LQAGKSVHVCEIDGCATPAPDGRWCVECTDQAAALDAWQRKHAEQRTRRAMRWNRLKARLWKWLWVPELVFVAGVWVYMVMVYGVVFLNWIHAGGWQ